MNSEHEFAGVVRKIASRGPHPLSIAEQETLRRAAEQTIARGEELPCLWSIWSIVDEARPSTDGGKTPPWNNPNP